MVYMPALGRSVAIAVASALACSAPVASPGDAAGCYQLAIGSWEPALAAAGPAAHPLPSAVYLDSALADGASAPWRVMNPNADWSEPPTFIQPPRWRLVSTDSLELVWSSLLLTYTAGLSREGRDWRGHIRFTTDLEPSPIPVAALTARPTACK
jgi:hypothetical protein